VHHAKRDALRSTSIAAAVNSATKQIEGINDNGLYGPHILGFPERSQLLLDSIWKGVAVQLAQKRSVR
jgi:hypothetical protein